MSEPLSREEYELVTQLVKSPGWRVLVEKLLMPELVQVTRHIDNVHSDERDTQLYRGAKLTLTRILQTAYKWAKLPNPFEVHYEGLLAAVRMYSDEEPPPKPVELQRVQLADRPKKVSHPV